MRSVKKIAAAAIAVIAAFSSLIALTACNAVGAWLVVKDTNELVVLLGRDQAYLPNNNDGFDTIEAFARGRIGGKISEQDRKNIEEIRLISDEEQYVMTMSIFLIKPKFNYLVRDYNVITAELLLRDELRYKESRYNWASRYITEEFIIGGLYYRIDSELKEGVENSPELTAGVQARAKGIISGLRRSVDREVVYD